MGTSTLPGDGLTSRVALVTGSTRGLGLAYARALLQRGMCVVTNGRSPEGPLVPREPERWMFVPADVSVADEAEALVAAVCERFGRLDVLVNNAGLYRDRSLLKTSDQEFGEVIRSHLYGTFFCGRAAARVMRDQGGGRIVNVSSDSASGVFGQSSYAAAKAGVIGLTMSWSIELARYSVWVNAILPNAATAPVLEVEGLAERWGYRGPFPRSMGEPEEVAPLVAFLACSEKAESLTGQVLALGGDRLAVWSWLSEEKVAFKEGGWPYEQLHQHLVELLGKGFRAPGFEP